MTRVPLRRHPYVVDPIPTDPDGSLIDFPGVPLRHGALLAADVLVTDYSSIVFDYALLDRPMLFYAYDLDRDGFHFDPAESLPGPLVRTAEELAEALRDIKRVHADYASRRADFKAKFCELADGHAAARVVERLFVA